MGERGATSAHSVARLLLYRRGSASFPREKRVYDVSTAYPTCVILYNIGGKRAGYHGAQLYHHAYWSVIASNFTASGVAAKRY